MIRVAQVMGHMVGGGVEATIMNHYRHIDRDRVQFDFIVDADSTAVPREEIEALGGRVFTVPAYKHMPQYLKACEQVFREEKPDIVHSNLNALSVFPLLAARRAGVPIRIAHSHSTSHPGEGAKTLMKTALRPFSKVNATHYAACSRVAAEWLFGKRVVSEGRVHYIHNAIDLGKFAFNQETRRRKRAELGVTEDTLLIGQVGRLCFQKNQMFTLDVFAQVLHGGVRAKLVFAGGGELRGDLERKANELGIASNVTFLGVRNDVAELYQAFDVVSFPSTYEGFGMAALEAQAAGCPVVASEFVPDEVCVVKALFAKVPLGDCRQWASAMMSLRNERDTDAHIVAQIRECGYDVADSAANLCTWYIRLKGER